MVKVLNCSKDVDIDSLAHLMMDDGWQYVVHPPATRGVWLHPDYSPVSQNMMRTMMWVRDGDTESAYKMLQWVST